MVEPQITRDQDQEWMPRVLLSKYTAQFLVLQGKRLFKNFLPIDGVAVPTSKNGTALDKSDRGTPHIDLHCFSS